MPNQKKIASNSVSSKKLLPVLFVAAFALFGSAYLLLHSHAATQSSVQFLNYASAGQTTGVTNVQAQVNSIGTQTVSQLAPGAKLNYLVGGKVPIKSECFVFNVLPLKGGSTTAKIEFVSGSHSVNQSITYNPNNPYWQQVCVNNESKALKGYSVFNRSPSTGPLVLVYQDIVLQ